MSFLRRMSSGRSAPPGLEWQIWKRLPAVLFWGLGLLALAGAWLWWQWPALPTPAEERALWLAVYRLTGVAVLHATLVFTVGVGCAIVMIMKGPAYSADSYPPADRARL